MVGAVRSPFVTYGVACAAVALATAVKMGLDPALGNESPFLLFFGAVMVSAWFGGLGPGFLATLASAIISAYVFFAPRFSLLIASPADRIRLMTFILEATLIALVGGALHGARRRAEESEQRLQADVAERSRLYRESETQRHVAESLGEVGRLLSQSLDFEAVVAQIVESVRTLLNVKATLLFTYDPDSGGLVARAGSGDVGARLSPPVVFPRGTNVVGYAVRERRPIATPDALADLRFPVDADAGSRLDTSPDRAILALPLLVKERIVGALSLRDVTGRVFSDAEIRLAQAFADQAAIAVDNSRLYVEAERRRGEAEALATAARLVTETLDVSVVASRIVASVRNILRVRSAGFRLLQPDGSLLALGAPGGAPGYAQPGNVSPSGYGISGRVIGIGAPYQSLDLLTDPDIVLTEEVRQRILASDIRAYLGVPLRAHGAVIGVLIVGDAAGRTFSRIEIELLQTFADQAALAVDNAQLYQRAQRAYEELSQAHAHLVRGETLRAVGELAAGAAHHLNNLLAVVLGRIQIALRRTENANLERDLRPAERAALDGAEVVKRLSRFSRGNPEPTITAVDLNELVEDVVELTRPRWQNELEARGVRVEALLELGSLPPVAADPPSVREVLVNLILNAVDAMPEGGRITLKTWGNRDGGYCSVHDTGAGMPPEVRRRALEPFFTTKGVKSTGLGLSVNYGIIQRHGGELTIDSEEGQGTTVTFRLPAASQVMRREPVPTAAKDGPRLRVLLIDDDEGVRGVVRDMLVEDGHEVLQAPDGPAGLELLGHAAGVELVLTDLGMLGMNGWDVARAVKASHPSTVVGLITGWDEGFGPKPAGPIQADLIVRKPVTQEALRSVIARAQEIGAVRS